MRNLGKDLNDCKCRVRNLQARYAATGSPAGSGPVDSVSDGFRIRDVDGNETRCEAVELAVAIASIPALREIRDGDKTIITCGSEIEAQLPLLLKPVVGDIEDSAETCAYVNGAAWTSCETADGYLVMLPGHWAADEEPEIGSCWAEFTVEEGEWNPLSAWTSIGHATPAVVVEYARYDHGGFEGGSAVAIRPFDDPATIFVDWLLNTRILQQVWEGDLPPYSPAVQLFSEAALASDQRAYWDTDLDGDDDCEWRVPRG